MSHDVTPFVVPVWTVLVGAATGFVALCGVMWGFFVWLRARISEGVREELHSDAFDARFTKGVTTAFADAARHLTTAISDLEARQRTHGARIGEIEQRVSKLEGRAHSTRVTDS